MATVDDCFGLLANIYQLVVYAELDRFGAIKHSEYIKIIEQEKNYSDDLYKALQKRGGLNAER